MIEQKPELAPGCYGMALAYSSDLPECTACPFASACGPIAMAMLDKFRRQMGIEKAGPIKRKARSAVQNREPSAVTPAAAPDALVQTVSKPVNDLMEKLGARGVALIDAIRAGRNPVQTPAFLKTAIDMLLAGPFDRATLRTALMTELSWPAQTADERVRQAIALLAGLGVTEERNGKIVRKVQ